MISESACAYDINTERKEDRVKKKHWANKGRTSK